MTHRLVTVTCLLHTQERWKSHRERLHNWTEVHFQCSTGPRSHNAKTGYTTMSKAKGLMHSHDTTGCVCVCVKDRERGRLWVHAGLTVWNTGLYCNIAAIHGRMTVKQSSLCLWGQGVRGTKKLLCSKSFLVQWASCQGAVSVASHCTWISQENSSVRFTWGCSFSSRNIILLLKTLRVVNVRDTEMSSSLRLKSTTDTEVLSVLGKHFLIHRRCFPKCLL